ncbi:MAG: DUF4349 domain-containing protein [Firmicutes bacterium]|nr:DUF4349 domain-containing protein [Bacillota bacterium]
MSGETNKKKLKRKIMCWWAGILCLTVLISSVGCSASSKDAMGQPGADQAAVEYNHAGSSEAPAEASFTGHPAAEEAKSAVTEEKRYVVLQARLTLEIKDLEAAARKIQERVKDAGGYLVSLEFYDLRDGRQAGQLSVRVPANKFDPFWDALDECGTVKNPHVYTDDVTMHYIDLEARLKNLAVQEERMRNLLERAKNVEEILQIEKELGRIRGDLEGMTAEFKHLQERVGYSSLEIRLEEKDPRFAGVTGGFDSYGERIGYLLSLNTNRLLRGFSTCLVVAVGSLPLLVPLLLLAFLGWKAVEVLQARKKKSLRKKDKMDQISS